LDLWQVLDDMNIGVLQAAPGHAGMVGSKPVFDPAPHVWIVGKFPISGAEPESSEEAEELLLDPEEQDSEEEFTKDTEGDFDEDEGFKPFEVHFWWSRPDHVAMAPPHDDTIVWLVRFLDRRCEGIKGPKTRWGRLLDYAAVPRPTDEGNEPAVISVWPRFPNSFEGLDLLSLHHRMVFDRLEADLDGVGSGNRKPYLRMLGAFPIAEPSEADVNIRRLCSAYEGDEEVEQFQVYFYWRNPNDSP
jgi:hypothetical protein